jgi:hypothetical protein
MTCRGDGEEEKLGLTGLERPTAHCTNQSNWSAKTLLGQGWAAVFYQ